MLVMGKSEPFLEFFCSCSFPLGEEGEARGSNVQIELVLFVRLILLLLRCFKVKHSLLRFLPFALF